MRQRASIFDRTAYVLFFPYILIFLIFVGGGWYISLSTTNKILDKNEIFLITGIIAVLIYAFARHTGSLIFEWRIGRGTKWRFLSSFTPLLMLSAVGFLSAIMLLVEGPSIVRENTSTAIEQISELRGRVTTVLQTPAFDGLQARIHPLRDQLAREIVNPAGGRYCGIGPSARAVLTEIQKELPSVRILSGTENIFDCRDIGKLQSIAAQYRAAVDQALETHPTTVAAHLTERRQLRGETEAALRSASDRLQALHRALAGVGTFVFNYGLYQKAVAELEGAAAVYSERVQRLKALAPEQASVLRPQIDVSISEQVATPTRLPNVVLSRLLDPRTAVPTFAYVVGAILADGLAALMVSAVFLYRREEQARTIDREAHFDVGGSGAKYLWIPERHPAA